jgi:hypothetical protein
MSNAMEAVVFGAPPLTPSGYLPGGSHPNVGEAIVKVVPRVEDNLFKYAEMNRAESSRREEPLPPGLGVVPPDWGSAERGAFSYSMLTPRQPGVGAIGLYLYEGRLGVLYGPLILDKPETYRDTTPEGFIEVVRLRHGIELGGFIASHRSG